MDSKLLERVRKLLNKAEAEGCTEQEAQALTAKASELMAKYGIDQALLDATAPQPCKPANKKIQIPNPWSKVHAHLLQGLARELGVQSVRLTNYKVTTVHLFGWDNDIERLELLYTSVMLQMANGSRRLTIPLYYMAPHVRAERRSWMLGYVAGVVEKVREAEARVVKETLAEKGTGAEMVLADRSLVVRNEFKAAYPSTRTTRATYTGRQYDNGYRAGRNANIGGRPVGRSSAGALR